MRKEAGKLDNTSDIAEYWSSMVKGKGLVCFYEILYSDENLKAKDDEGEYLLFPPAPCEWPYPLSLEKMKRIKKQTEYVEKQGITLKYIGGLSKKGKEVFLKLFMRHAVILYVDKERDILVFGCFSTRGLPSQVHYGIAESRIKVAQDLQGICSSCLHVPNCTTELAEMLRKISSGEVKCPICGEVVPLDDPAYPNHHNDCAINIVNEMEELGMIKIISRSGATLAWKFTESFDKFLYKTMDFVHEHILHDKTVDVDIIDMQGILKAVTDYVPKSTPDEKIGFYVGFIFDNLMMLRYGRPLPQDKRFASRVKEFLEEVHGISLSEEEARLFKVLRKALREKF
jgi:hypothetical protein